MKYPWFKTSFDNKLILKNISQLILENKMSMGDEVYKLEKIISKMLKIKYVVLTTSGTAALTMATSALNITSKSRVICTNLTWIATLNPAIFAGANIRLVDTYSNNQCVNFEKLLMEIKSFKPDVVYLVHLNGDIYYSKELDKLKKKMGFKIIEDAAQSFLVKNNKIFCGTKHEVGCFSLGVTKLINMIYGGFCVTNSKDTYNNLMAVRNNGVNSFSKNTEMELATNIGFNLKPSNLHAAIGNINLKSSSEKIKRIKLIYSIYKKIFNDHKKIKIVENYSIYAIPFYILVFVKNKPNFIKYCKKNNIVLHFALRTISETGLVKTKKNYPNSIFFSKNLIRLPCGPGYSLQDIKTIGNILSAY